MPIVTVQQSPRDLEAKRRLVAGITNAFVDAYDVTPQQVQVFIAEFSAEHWAKAGKLSSIRTLGGHRRYRESEVRGLLSSTAGIPQMREPGES